LNNLIQGQGMQHLQPGIEDLDIAVRQVNELGKRWNNGLTIENFRLAERYFKGELVFLLQLRPKWPSDAEDFFAVFDGVWPGKSNLRSAGADA
jgi:hypothetical protein